MAKRRVSTKSRAQRQIATAKKKVVIAGRKATKYVKKNPKKVAAIAAATGAAIGLGVRVFRKRKK